MLKFSDELADEQVVAGTWENLFIIDLRGLLTLAHLHRMAAVQRRLEERAERWVSVTFARQTAQLPDATTRQTSSELLKRVQRAAAVITVIEGSGIKSLALRTMVRTLNTLARSQQKIAASLDEALTLVAPHVTAPRAELRAGIVELRARLGG